MVKYFINKVFSLNSNYRRLILIFADAFILIVSILISSRLQLKEIYPNFLYEDTYLLLLVSLFIGICLYLFTGQYSGLTRYLSRFSLYLICLRNSCLVILISLMSWAFGVQYYKISFLAIYLVLNNWDDNLLEYL